MSINQADQQGSANANEMITLALYVLHGQVRANTTSLRHQEPKFPLKHENPDAYLRVGGGGGVLTQYGSQFGSDIVQDGVDRGGKGVEYGEGGGGVLTQYGSQFGSDIVQDGANEDRSEIQGKDPDVPEHCQLAFLGGTLSGQALSPNVCSMTGTT